MGEKDCVWGFSGTLWFADILEIIGNDSDGSDEEEEAELANNANAD